MKAPAVYAPHEAYVFPARYRSHPGRLILGILLAEVLFTLGLDLFDRLMMRISPEFADAVYYGDSPTGLLLQLASYGILALALVVVVNKLHLRHTASLFGPGAQRRLLPRAFIGAMTFYLVLQLAPPWADLMAAQSHRNLAGWLGLLPFALLALLIQTGAEEMFYRGYIQQQIAARFPDPRIWMVVPNLLFAWVHWESGGQWVANWQYVIWAFAFGLACSDLTARSGSLYPAIGLHLANNAYAFLFFADLDGFDSGLALFLYPAAPLTQPVTADGPIVTLALLVELSLIGLAWLATRLAIRR